jgi:heptosyltransferase-2
MERVLIIQTAFIGDVILSTVLIENLKKQYPQARIDFLVKKGNEALLDQHPLLHEVLVWDKRNGKYKNLVKLLTHIRKQRYDLVVNVQRFAATGLLAAFSGADVVVGYDKNPLSFLYTQKIKHVISSSDHWLHETTRCNQLIESFVPVKITRPQLYPSILDYAKVAQYQKQEYLVFAPGSIWATKQLPVSKWIAIASKLPADLPIYIIGSKADKVLADEIMDAFPERTSVLSLAGELSLLESAALMQGALYNLVNDSAPMHLASAVNGPTIAFYCSTSPAFGFTPLAEDAHIIEVTEGLSCRPCGLHGKKACPQQHFNCGNLVDADRVARVILNRYYKLPGIATKQEIEVHDTFD